MTRHQRTQELLARPDLMDDIVAHMANGGEMINFCKGLDVRWSDVWAWIAADPERKRRYDDSLTARQEWMIQRVLGELQAIATVDIRQAYDEHGRLKPVAEWPSELAAAVVSVETDELFDGGGKDREHVGFTKKLRFADKLRALELLGKKLALWVERHEVSGKVTLEDLVTASRTTEG